MRLDAIPVIGQELPLGKNFSSISDSHAVTNGTMDFLSQNEHCNEDAQVILENSIHKLQTSQSYAVEIHYHATILGIPFTGKGIYYQKHQREGLSPQEHVFVRWEMNYYFPTFQQSTYSILNGEQMKLWRSNERRAVDTQNGIVPGMMGTRFEVVDLKEVEDTITANPGLYRPLRVPWYTQPHIDQMLQGIRDSYFFTMVATRHTPNLSRNVYQICGILKPEIAKKILEVREIDGVNPDRMEARNFSETADFLSFLPLEVPTYVEIWLDQAQGTPDMIRFFQKNDGEKNGMSRTGNKRMGMEVTILFENTYLNNADFNDRLFEVDTAEVTNNVTEEYIKNMENPR